MAFADQPARNLAVGGGGIPRADAAGLPAWSQRGLGLPIAGPGAHAFRFRKRQHNAR